MTRHRLFAGSLGVGFAAAMLVLSACGGGGSASSGGGSGSGAPIVIGAINEGSGSAAQPQYAGGITAAVGYINSIGGVGGRQLKLDLCNVDDSSTAMQTCAEHFVQTKPAFVTVGVANQLGVAYPLLAAAGIPLIGGTPVDSADYAAKGAHFLNGGSVAVQAGISEFVKQDLPDVKSAGIVAIDVPVSHQAFDQLKTLLTGNGLTVSTTYVPVTAQDYLTPLESAMQPAKDAIIAGTATSGCLSLAKAAQSQNIKAKFISAGPCNDAGLIKSAGGAMTGWYVWAAGPDANDTSDPQVATYQKAISQFGGSGATIGTPSETTFGDVMTVYQDILKKLPSNGITSAAIAGAINNPAGGPRYFGGSYKCGQVSAFPAVCNFETRWFQINGDGSLRDATNGKYIDGASVLG